MPELTRDELRARAIACKGCAHFKREAGNSCAVAGRPIVDLVRGGRCPMGLFPGERASRRRRRRVSRRRVGGVGTELKRGLAELGLAGARGCGCDERAALMDRRGVAWCEANVAVIVGWLREGAAAAGWGAQVTDEVLAAAVGVAIERFKGTSDGGQRPFEDSVTGG